MKMGFTPGALALVLATSAAHSATMEASSRTNSFYPSEYLFKGADGNAVLNSQVISADFSGDGQDDLLFRFTNNLRTRLSTQEGQFSNAKTLTLSQTYAEDPLVADINNDGRKDLVFFGQNPGLFVHSYLSDGNGGFSRHSRDYPDGSIATINRPVAGDVSGDGKEDLIFYFHSQGQLVLRNRISSGNGDFPLSQYRYTIADGDWMDNTPLIGDVNGDKRSDLVFYEYQSNGTYKLVSLIAKSGGGYDMKVQQLAGPTDAGGLPFVMLDLNGDNKQELVANGYRSGMQFQAYRYAGSGFSAYAMQQTGYGHGVLANAPLTGDFNGDGRQDLAYYFLDGEQQLEVRHFLSNGSGRFNLQRQMTQQDKAIVKHRPVVLNQPGHSDLVFLWTNSSSSSNRGLFINTKSLMVESAKQAEKERILSAGFDYLDNYLRSYISGNNEPKIYYVQSMSNLFMDKLIEQKDYARLNTLAGHWLRAVPPEVSQYYRLVYGKLPSGATGWYYKEYDQKVRTWVSPVTSRTYYMQELNNGKWSFKSDKTEWSVSVDNDIRVSQYSYLISRAIRHFLSFPASVRASYPNMQALVDVYLPIMVQDVYGRFLFESNGGSTLEQRSLNTESARQGMEALDTPRGFFRAHNCRLPQDNASASYVRMNHEDLLTLKLKGHQGQANTLYRDYAGFPRDEATRFCNALFDKDMWFVAGAAEILMAYQQVRGQSGNAFAAAGLDLATRVVPNATGNHSYLTRLEQYLGLGVQFIKAKLTPTSVQDIYGNTQTAYTLDKGAYKTFFDYWYAGNQSSDIPCKGKVASQNCFDERQLVDDVSWDLSHGRRLVHFFKTMDDASSRLSGVNFHAESRGMALQMQYKVFNGDFNKPAFRNFFDGSNGWYRVDYSGREDFGYRPWGMSSEVISSGFMYWGAYLGEMRWTQHALWDMAFTSDSSVQQHRRTHYDQAVFSNGLPLTRDRFNPADYHKYLYYLSLTE